MSSNQIPTSVSSHEDEEIRSRVSDYEEREVTSESTKKRNSKMMKKIKRAISFNVSPLIHLSISIS
jgi:hypothetical protein